MPRAEALRHHTLDPIALGVIGEKCQRGFEQRDLHVLPLTGLLTVHQSRQDAHQCMHAGGLVERGKRTPYRPAILFSGQTHDAGKRLPHQIVTGLLPHRPGSAVSGNGAIDQARIDLAQAAVVDAEALCDPGAIAFDDDLCGLGNFLDDLHTFRRFEIDCDTLLVSIHCQEYRALPILAGRPGTCVIATLGRFDLDHLGTQLSQVLGAQRPRQDFRQIQHAHALEREHGIHLLKIMGSLVPAGTGAGCVEQPGGRRGGQTSPHDQTASCRDRPGWIVCGQSRQLTLCSLADHCA